MPTIHLHLRILVSPVETVARIVSSCKAVFKQADVSIDVVSRITLNLSQAQQTLFAPVNVRKACQGNGMTVEQRNLFALAPGIDARDIVIFFAHSTNKAVDGCSQHPPGSPGAIVTALSTRWTMAHEIGHLLGLSHVDRSNRLMFGKGTLGIAANPPLLTQPEIDAIHKSKLVHLT